MTQNTTIDPNLFLVCGLGSLGQYCVSALKEFGVKVNAIEEVKIQNWEIPELPDLIDELVIGDCRQPKILEQAGIKQCRAILIVTSDERVNIAVAFAARSLNPNVRLVIRSAQDNLNELLAENLGNFVAFEATQLPANSFALAALSSETRGFFTLENRLLRVISLSIDSCHRWCNCPLSEINSSQRRVLIHTRASQHLLKGFYQWQPDAQVLPGDTVVYIDVNENLVARQTRYVNNSRQSWLNIFAKMTWQNLSQKLTQFWAESSQTRRVAFAAGIVIVSLFLCGTLLYKLQYPQIAWQNAFNVALVLSLGGYGDLFGQEEISFTLQEKSYPVPWWLYLFSISMSVAGTIFVGIIYAVMTERLLSTRFQFSKGRPPVPKLDHVVLIGIGRVGLRVAQLLQELRQPLVGVHTKDLEPGILPQMPLVVGNINNALTKVNLQSAKSVIVLTDDEVANLEIALKAKTVNPQANLVIRTFDPRFSENVARLLPYARVLGVYALAAEAFAGAAFGENILNLFRLDNQTTLVTEYQIAADDNLNGKLLADVAYGYGVVPILHMKVNQYTSKLMPSDDIKLVVGDRLVVLATIEGLQRVERGLITPGQLLVRIKRVNSPEAAFEGAAVISRVTGCDMHLARTLMNQLPATLQYPLYKHQAHRLVHELSKAQVLAHIE
ncbi:NAD-binding protein [Nostoc sp. FACHB-152]|uniref:potassium channel family protein n=1 Tax=unclassified Nostoc TaxID=2593658 RepID=UPI0016882C2E|nr:MULTISPECIES: NAD-binding protein [unclassified Nostoc]MBD2445732.1 NAD-binding protein [Nostoc sp. FACHB-152]MBD2466846.1 NAD-binding protein [Nostoc sp. FACHB-145]